MPSSPCSQTLHTLRVLCSQGLPIEGLFEVYRGVVIAKLLYAASAWWGFTSADDKLSLAAFIRCSIRQGFCAPDIASFSDFIDSTDDDLFKQILSYQSVADPGGRRRGRPPPPIGPCNFW